MVVGQNENLNLKMLMTCRKMANTLQILRTTQTILFTQDRDPFMRSNTQNTTTSNAMTNICSSSLYYVCHVFIIFVFIEK